MRETLECPLCGARVDERHHPRREPPGEKPELEPRSLSFLELERRSASRRREPE